MLLVRTRDHMHAKLRMRRKKKALIAGFKSGDPEARRKPWRLWMRGFLRA
jgi:hypothetical protein